VKVRPNGYSISAVPTAGSVSCSGWRDTASIGIDTEKLDGVGDRLDGFVRADLNVGLPAEVGKDF